MSVTAPQRRSTAPTDVGRVGEIPVPLSMAIELNRWLAFGIIGVLLVVAAVIIVLLRNQEP
jgi:hypothetical protein